MTRLWQKGMMPGIEAWLSLIGPAYFAYIGLPMPVIVVWAIICAALWVWNNRPSKRQGPPRSWPAALTFFAVVAACYVAAHMAVYLLVRYLAGIWL